MKDKSQRAGRGPVLTETEIKRLSQAKPGESLSISGLLITCKASKAYLSGINCQMCALYHTGCRGVACMSGSTYENADGTVSRRETDVCYVVYLDNSQIKLRNHGSAKG